MLQSFLLLLARRGMAVSRDSRIEKYPVRPLSRAGLISLGSIPRSLLRSGGGSSARVRHSRMLLAGIQANFGLAPRLKHSGVTTKDDTRQTVGMVDSRVNNPG